MNRVCIDFTNLNKASRKDSFSLLSIDQIIDAKAGHELLSFMDAYLENSLLRAFGLTAIPSKGIS